MRLISEYDLEGGGIPLIYDYAKQDNRFIENRMDMMGYNLALSRTFDTTYQNTSGRIRLCIISCAFVTSDGDRIYVEGKIGATSASNTAISIGLYNQTGAALTVRQPAIFIVPNGWYYQCAITGESGSPGSAILAWVEYDLHSAAPQVIS